MYMFLRSILNAGYKDSVVALNLTASCKLGPITQPGQPVSHVSRADVISDKNYNRTEHCSGKWCMNDASGFRFSLLSLLLARSAKSASVGCETKRDVAQNGNIVSQDERWVLRSLGGGAAKHTESTETK